MLIDLIEYISAVVRTWWWVMFGVAVGSIKAWEWLMRNGQPIRISKRIRWGLALCGLCIAQYLAYNDLRKNKRLLEQEKQALASSVSGLTATVREQSKRIDDLKNQRRMEQLERPPLTLSSAPKWVGDVRFTQENEKHELGYATWLHIYPDVALAPPVLRVELDVDAEITQVYLNAGVGRAVDKKVSPRIHEISIEGPAVPPGQYLGLTLFAPNSFRALKVSRFGVSATPTIR